MRVEPGDETVNSEQAKRRYQRRVDRITRIVALIVAVLSTYSLILKILFF